MMALELGKLYQALRSANVPDDQAHAAAEEAAGYENRLGKVESDLHLLKWMVATNIAVTLIVLGLQLRVLH
jgi:hypothetical protein